MISSWTSKWLPKHITRTLPYTCRTTNSLHSFDSLEYECDTHTITRRACRRVAKLYYDVVKHIDPDESGA